MKGILEKKLNGWFVNFTENHPSLMVKQYNKSLPLNPHNIPEYGPYVVGIYEEVEFEIEDYWETGLEEVFKVATLITKPLTELKYRDGRPMRSYHSPKIQELLDEIHLEEVSKEQLEKERNPAYEYFDIKKNLDKFSLFEHKDTTTSADTPTSSQTEIEKNNMILELTKDDLIKLVKGSTPKNNLMGKYSKLDYGNYIGGFVDEWSWYDWVLEELGEEELYKIFKECGELE